MAEGKLNLMDVFGDNAIDCNKTLSPLPPLASPQEDPNPISSVNHHQQQRKPKRHFPSETSPVKKIRLSASMEEPSCKEAEEEGKGCKAVKLFGVWINTGSIVNINKDDDEEEEKLALEELLLLLECEDFAGNAGAEEKQRTSSDGEEDDFLQEPHPVITKKLTFRDVHHYNCRLSLHEDDVVHHILPYLSDGQRTEICTWEGLTLDVTDLDTSSIHTLSLKKGKTGYVFRAAGWSSCFVGRRDLAPGDEIGLSCYGSCIEFSVLRRAPRPAPECSQNE